jgi:Fe-S-cluster containining protein
MSTVTQNAIVRITRRKQRRRRKDLTVAQKSELCQSCGKCCMAMTFDGGEVDDDALDQIRWLELHGVRVDYHRRRGLTSYYYTFPTPCSQLQVDAGRYSCAIYDTRPKMCRDYEGWAAGPTGVPDCLWFEPDDA